MKHPKHRFVLPDGCQLPGQCGPDYHRYVRGADETLKSGRWECNGPCGFIKPNTVDVVELNEEEALALDRLKRFHSNEGAGTSWRHEPIFACDTENQCFTERAIQLNLKQLPPDVPDPHKESGVIG